MLHHHPHFVRHKHRDQAHYKFRKVISRDFFIIVP
jgi:hypothetical protein